MSIPLIHPILNMCSPYMFVAIPLQFNWTGPVPRLRAMVKNHQRQFEMGVWGVPMMCGWPRRPPLGVDLSLISR